MIRLGTALIISSLIISASLIYSKDRYEIRSCTLGKGSYDGINLCHIVFDKRTGKTYEYDTGMGKNDLGLKERPDTVMEKDVINRTKKYEELE